MILLLTGCSGSSANSGDKIVAPSNITSAIQGKWYIDKCLTEGYPSRGSTSEGKWLGKTITFSKDSALMGDNYLSSIRYKAKRVDSNEYLLRKYLGPASNLGITSKETFVITLSSGDKFLYDFIRISDKELVANIDEEYYHLIKLDANSDEQPQELIAADLSKKQASSTAGDKILESGIFLGIRRLSGSTGGIGGKPKQYNYVTYWIAASNKVLRPVLQSGGIFLPRRSGFWKVGVTTITAMGKSEDVLSAFSVSSGEAAAPEPIETKKYWADKTGYLSKAINFIGNDYASVEYTGAGTLQNGKKWSENRLATLLVDKISTDENVKLSDISGENGTLAVESAAAEMLSASNIKKLKKYNISDLERNFSLYRKTGHWFIKGRFDMLMDEAVPYTDFNINLIPPSTVVAYDELQVSWAYVKSRFPDAIDVFTSPNRDIAIIYAGKLLYIYLITGNELSDTPLAKITMQDGDVPVMAEWGMGSYTEKWEKAFIKYNETSQVNLSK